MALPTTIISTPGIHCHHPPFKSSAGNFYALIKKADDNNILRMYKSSDPTGDNWVIQDEGGSPGRNISGGFSSVQDGDDIHIARVGFDNNMSYSKFSMSSDTWTVIQEPIEDPTNAPNQPWVSIAVRSDGDVVVVYNGDTDQNMGDTKERVDVNIRTGGTWGGPVSLDAGGDVHYGNPNCVLGTNDFVHCLWQRQTSATPDPSISWADTQGRSLDPADDSLSTVDASDANTGGALLGFPNLVTYDDGGTQRIIVSGFIADGTSLETAQATEDGSDEILLTATGVTESFSAEPGFINGEVGVSTFVELSDEIHCLYSGDGVAGVDQDLWYTTSTDDGASWSAPTEEVDGVTVNFISANIYVRGLDTVLAYVYDDGGVQKYNEKVLIAGVAAAQTHQMML